MGGGDLLYGILKGLLELEEKGNRILPTVWRANPKAPPTGAGLPAAAHRVEPLAEATSIAASINER